MLSEVFYWVLNMSITAGITGLIVLALDKIRRVPRRVAVVLWAIPFLRMLLPLGLNRPYSLMTLITRLTGRTVTVFRARSGWELSMMNSVQAADDYFPLTYGEAAVGKLFSVAAVIWLCGALAIGAIVGFTYFSALIQARGAKAGEALAPAVYGIVRPKIVLPPTLRGAEREFVLMHERAHIRRGDNLWRLLALGIAAVYWFQPLTWLFLKHFFADIELACDECVLARLDEAGRKDYARALLAAGERRSVLVSAFGGAKMRARIENILSFRRMTWLSSAGFGALLLAMGCILLTNGGGK